MGRGWDVEGAHTRGYNSVALAASIMGTFTEELPNDAAIQTTLLLWQCGVELVTYFGPSCPKFTKPRLGFFMLGYPFDHTLPQ